MAHDVRIAISCPDRTGLLSALTGRLFDLGADMGDASFAVLGEAAEFATVARLPDSVAAADVHNALAALPELEGAEISVTAFALGVTHGESAHVTHRIEVRGTDRPGLVARLTEAFAPRTMSSASRPGFPKRAPRPALLPWTTRRNHLAFRAAPRRSSFTGHSAPARAPFFATKRQFRAGIAALLRRSLTSA